MAGVAASDYLTVDSVVCRHHLYKEIWTPEIEELQLEQECRNAYDQYAIAVMKDRLLVSRVARELSQIIWLFLTQEEILHVRSKGKGKGVGD